jgi:hypothetical protein
MNRGAPASAAGTAGAVSDTGTGVADARTSVADTRATDTVADARTAVPAAIGSVTHGSNPHFIATANNAAHGDGVAVDCCGIDVVGVRVGKIYQCGFKSRSWKYFVAYNHV